MVGGFCMLKDVVLVGEIEKNRTESVQINLKSYNGHDLIDIRVLFESEQAGAMIPTKKGKY